MAKITYSSLKLKANEDVKTFDFNGTTVEVKQYLPISSKMDLIEITLQKAKEGALYNPAKIEMFFHLHLVYLYTNLTFTDKQREDEYKLYDTLEGNSFIGAVIQEMDPTEYNNIIRNINELVKNELTYSTTAAGIIDNLMGELPKVAETAKNLVEGFKPEQYQAVMDFAKAANGGRDI